jgi:hypothetical protein
MGLPTLGKGKATGVIVKTWPILVLGRCSTTFILETLPGNDWPWLQKHMGPRSLWLQAKKVFTPTKTLACHIFDFIKFSPKHTVEAAEPPQSYFWSNYPWFRVRARSKRSRPHQVDYLDGALQHLYNEHSLKIIDHGSRSPRGPGPSKSRLQAQNMICPHWNSSGLKILFYKVFA